MARKPWLLSLDLMSAKALVWIASWGKEHELTVEAHRYFHDRYCRLAQHYREQGQPTKAAQYQVEADGHDPGGGQGPPYAAAMAMPRPARFVQTNAVSESRLDGTDDAA